MKKLLSLVLASVMIFSLAACNSGTPDETTTAVEEATEGEGSTEEVAVEKDYKIGIVTGTVSQGEEEFRAAENMKAKYGDMIVTTTYPDNFTAETETLISNVVSIASDPAVKAIVFCQAVPGASAAIDKVRETRPDMLFVAGVPGEDPGVIASKADVVLQADELAMGTTIIEQAKAMGAENFVHYSFPRHMSYALLAARRDLMRENCEALGLNFVEGTAPDPTGDAGVPGAQMFILEDVPRKVEELGEKTAFFSTNCSMQEPLIRAVLETGALFPQQCCPSPLHGYPGALGIPIPEEKQGDIPYIIEEIKTKIAEGNGTGRFSTWAVPINMLFVEAGTEYAIAYCEGETDGVYDQTVLDAKLEAVAGGPGILTVSQYDEDGVSLPNFNMILCEFINF